MPHAEVILLPCDILTINHGPYYALRGTKHPDHIDCVAVLCLIPTTVLYSVNLTLKVVPVPIIPNCEDKDKKQEGSR